MTQIDQQLNAIRGCQNAVAFDANDEQGGGDVENSVSFTLEVTADISEGEIRRALQVALPDIAFILEQMFDGADNTRFYYLEVVGVSFDEIDGSEFAIAHRLLMVPGVISADADMETDLHSWQGEATESEAAFAAIKSLCFVDEDEVNVPKHKGWALVSTKVDTAWKEFGVTGLGVKLAQIDTGLAEHVEFDGRAIDNSLGINIYKPGRGAVDPLKKRFFGFDQPGHGTAVGSVIISQGGLDNVSTTAPGEISGVAQGVDYLPIRAIRSVIRIKQSKVARAIDAAINNGANIISMSFGGVKSKALRQALIRAEAANVIVMAAAGNCTPIVAWPAAYDACIAVSGITHEGKKWRGAATGKEVDFSAPAEFVYHAMRNKPEQDKDINKPGQGTSFAVAISAGIAALWLERFGRDALIANLAPGESLMQRFRTMAKRTATPGPNWKKHELGAGIINAHKLLHTYPFIDLAGFSAMANAASEIKPINDTSNAEMIRELFPGLSAHPTVFSSLSDDDELLEACGQEIIYRIMKSYALERRTGSSEDLKPPTEALSYLQNKYPSLSDLKIKTGEE